MPQRLPYQPPVPFAFDPAKYQHLLTTEKPESAPEPPAPSRSPLYRAGEWTSQLGQGLDMMSTLNFLFHGDTEHNPLFGARPNPAVIAAAKGGNDALTRWIMSKMVDDLGLPDWLAGAYGMWSGFLPLKAGIGNLR